jgi:hypothetical protein
LIQEATFFRESNKSSGLSQVIFLVDVVHLWVEHHNSVDKSVQSEVVRIWINHVHDVVTHSKLNKVAWDGIHFHCVNFILVAIQDDVEVHGFLVNGDVG